MKQILTLLLLAASTGAWAEEFATAGTGAAVTPATLSALSGSGVTAAGDGTYTFANDVTVTSPDKFSLGDAKTIKLADNVRVTLCGQCDLTAPEVARLTVTRAADTDNPAGFYLRNENGITGKIANVDFYYAQLSSFSATGFDIENCTFTLGNGKLSSSAALSLGTAGAQFNIKGCTFTDCTVPAIGEGANAFCGINIENCTFVNNNTSNTNKPQINITVGGDLTVAIRGCKLQGKGLSKVGGIAVGNLLSNPGANKVIIENCEITDHRYGLTGVGAMNMEIRGNRFVGNNHESNPMNGGSAINLTGYNYGLNAVISGNHIENSLWGVTLVGCSDVSLGKVGDADSPGGNTFKDNGNLGVPYDLYNNGTTTVYAQLNTWSVPEQTEAEIEKVIFHKKDDSKLGEVIFMPAADGAGIDGITADDNAPARFFDLQGRPADPASRGVLIEVRGGKATKVVK